MEDINLKEEFFYSGNETGCLLVHGFTSTPAELRELGDKLRNEGYSVLGVRLKGHGTTVEDMEKCTYHDWIGSAEEGYNRLRKNCSKIYVIGHSMGSLLALYLSENFDVDKIVTLSPPFIIKDKRSEFAFIIKYFLRFAGHSGPARPNEESKYLLNYTKVPIKSLHEFNKLRNIVRKNLNKVSKPILILHSYKDGTADVRSVNVIDSKVKVYEKKIVYLENCGHHITIEGEKQIVFDEVIQFLKK